MNKVSPNLINRIHNENCLDGMRKLPDACIPMTDLDLAAL